MKVVSSLKKPSVTEFAAILQAFGCARGDSLDYVKVHYERYLTTLNLMRTESQLRILELGGSYPYAFTLMLRAACPRAEIILSNYEEASSKTAVNLHNTETGEEVYFENRSFNIETDQWPFEDSYFDVVLCMEIIEHLLLDPCFFSGKHIEYCVQGENFW